MTAPASPPPADAVGVIRAQPGRAQVTLFWEQTPGALGYQVYRADGAGREYAKLGGPVPYPPFVDSTGEPGRAYLYAIAPVFGVGPGQLGAASLPVAAASGRDADATVRIGVHTGHPLGERHRPWRRLVGSGPLTAPLDRELEAGLRTAHGELQFPAISVLGLLDGVYRELDGRASHDFRPLDAVVDTLLELDLRPVIELGFMPPDLARDPAQRLAGTDHVISPPREWRRWVDLVGDLVAHLVDRYGRYEVRGRWAFQVWRAGDLDRLWGGNRSEFISLYDLTARTVKAVDPELRVGAPASVGGEWLPDLLGAHTQGVPLDFAVATLPPGGLPLDLRPFAARYGRADLDLWWTEQPVGGDGVLAGARLLHALRAASGRVGALVPAAVSDHAVLGGPPTRLLADAPGLLTVGNLRKPRYWAVQLVERLGEPEFTVAMTGDGAGGMVEAWAAPLRGAVAGVLVFNGAAGGLSPAAQPGALDRRIVLDITGLPDTDFRLTHRRIDVSHSNVSAAWTSLGGGEWPGPQQWSTLRQRSGLVDVEPERVVRAVNGTVNLTFDLPMPGISYLELTHLG